MALSQAQLGYKSGCLVLSRSHPLLLVVTLVLFSSTQAESGYTGDSCSSCAAGQFALYGGSAACFDCNPGTFTAQTGSTGCDLCPGEKTKV